MYKYLFTFVFLIFLSSHCIDGAKFKGQYTGEFMDATSWEGALVPGVQENADIDNPQSRAFMTGPGNITVRLVSVGNGLDPNDDRLVVQREMNLNALVYVYQNSSIEFTNSNFIGAGFIRLSQGTMTTVASNFTKVHITYGSKMSASGLNHFNEIQNNGTASFIDCEKVTIGSYYSGQWDGIRLRPQTTITESNISFNNLVANGTEFYISQSSVDIFGTSSIINSYISLNESNMLVPEDVTLSINGTTLSTSGEYFIQGTAALNGLSNFTGSTFEFQLEGILYADGIFLCQECTFNTPDLDSVMSMKNIESIVKLTDSTINGPANFTLAGGLYILTNVKSTRLVIESYAHSYGGLFKGTVIQNGYSLVLNGSSTLFEDEFINNGQLIVTTKIQIADDVKLAPTIRKIKNNGLLFLLPNSEIHATVTTYSTFGTYFWDYYNSTVYVETYIHNAGYFVLDKGTTFQSSSPLVFNGAQSFLLGTNGTIDSSVTMNATMKIEKVTVNENFVSQEASILSFSLNTTVPLMIVKGSATFDGSVLINVLPNPDIVKNTTYELITFSDYSGNFTLIRIQSTDVHLNNQLSQCASTSLTNTAFTITFNGCDATPSTTTGTPTTGAPTTGVPGPTTTSSPSSEEPSFALSKISYLSILNLTLTILALLLL
ncbi:putative cell surface glycoprotein [Heterostelium album PN500]|uniref:Putative cell surface glycoprotein n=1 Tax=Heterostelium pallidum (strain ATCC 26659 / Pp 5 / PN500) TaxID=670386 RepID=D3BIH9_HETP5|nr:putative cell surface glycoprotein [Heterostelium album PN500]EFA78603.1 putative cell surface glycoprotein [Heterostelium album PN500]|eukprot:XP_020430727.1 putative cell surface glycoprotein [Heterostelium album PN500]